MQANRTISRKSKQLRKSLKLSKKDLATRSGISADTIRRIEQAEFTGYTPHLDTLNNLAKGFRMSLEDFLTPPHRVRAQAVSA